MSRLTDTERLCSFPECSKAVRAKGLCMGHYKQRSLGKPLTPLKKTKPSVDGCYFPGCSGPHWGNGLCRTHNRQKNESGGFAPPDSAFRIQHRYAGRWFTVDFGNDRKSTHRAVNVYRAKHPDSSFRIIIGMRKSQTAHE
jgi:hypothetical protein